MSKLIEKQKKTLMLLFFLFCKIDTFQNISTLAGKGFLGLSFFQQKYFLSHVAASSDFSWRTRSHFSNFLDVKFIELFFSRKMF